MQETLSQHCGGPPAPPGPPAAPVGSPMRRPGGLPLAWTLVLLAVAGIASAGWFLAAPAEETDDTATLVLLTLQAKVLAAANALKPGAVERELPGLNGLAATPAVARALAALNAFTGGENGEVRARMLLAHQRGEIEDPEEQQLHEDVRRALTEPDALDEPQRERILREMGWFGKLLLARTRPPDDPLRREVMFGAFRALVAMTALVALAFVGTAIGLVLLIAGLVGYVVGWLRVRMGTGSGLGAVYVQAFAVYVGTVFLFQVVPAALGVELPWLGILGVLLASLGGVTWPFLRGVPAETARRELGLHRGEGVLREIGCGLVGYLAILPIVAVGFLLSIVLIFAPQWLAPPSADEPPQLVSHPVAVWMAHGGIALRIGVLLLAAGFAPFFEETMFRGALQRGLRERLGPVTSALIIALIFAVIHPQGLLLVPALGALAFGFSLLREWRGSLIAPMVGHALHNGTLVAFMWVAFS